MKHFYFFFSLIFGISSLLMPYFFLSDSFAEENDVEEKRAILNEDPSFTYDESGDPSRMKFCVEGETVPYWIPMILIGDQESESLLLRAGDEIRLFVKKQESFTLMDKFYARTGRRVYGFGKSDEPLFFTATEAFAHFNGSLMRFFAILSFAGGSLLLFFAFKSFG